MSVNPISPDVFQGGQMTDLPAFSGTLDGTELMEIVAAPSGQSNAASGVNYQVNTEQLAALLGVLSFTTVVISDGQYTNPAAPYIPASTVARIYVNKVVGSPTYIQFAAAAVYVREPMVKDTAGTVGIGTDVHVTFSSGQTADGNAAVPISTPYGGYFFRPITDLNTWTLGSA